MTFTAPASLAAAVNTPTVAASPNTRQWRKPVLLAICVASTQNEGPCREWWRNSLNTWDCGTGHRLLWPVVGRKTADDKNRLSALLWQEHARCDRTLLAARHARRGKCRRIALPHATGSRYLHALL